MYEIQQMSYFVGAFKVPRHTMLDCVYNFLHTNFYEVVHVALYNNVHDFDNCYSKGQRKNC